MTGSYAYSQPHHEAGTDAEKRDVQRIILFRYLADNDRRLHCAPVRWDFTDQWLSETAQLFCLGSAFCVLAGDWWYGAGNGWCGDAGHYF